MVKALLAMGVVLAVAIGMVLPAPSLHNSFDSYMRPGVASE